MSKIDREDIQIISRNSNWSEAQIEKVLKENVYNNKEAWYKFLRLFFISLGVGFTTAGIIFFFAYNWADLHKFVKLGLIEGIIVISTTFILFSNLNIDIKNILLTGTSIMVGVLFAVFGQVYQTGANAYDFFLGWTLFITLWVVVSNYTPLWFLFIILINTTLVLYWKQVAHDWTEVFMFTLIFIVNSGFLIASIFITKLLEVVKIPIWFSNTLSLATVSCSTIGVTLGIFEQQDSSFCLLVLITTLLYMLGIYFALNSNSGLYLATISFSIIIIVSALLLNLSNDFMMLLFISLFVIASVTFVIKNLINLQKKWAN